MANGYCPALLTTIEAVAGNNAPSSKMQMAGFLAALQCCQNSSVNPINEGNADSGHQRSLTVSYRQRSTVDLVQDEDDCDINNIPSKLEWTLPTLSHKQISFFLSDEEISKYCEEASRPRTIGTPATGIMQEHYELFKDHANTLMRAVNTELVTLMATEFGVNTTTGSATGKVINFDRNGDQLILDNGIVEMLADLRDNEICGTPCLVGGGIFANFTLAQMAACCNAAGIDQSKFGIPPLYYDKDTQAIWGANSVGLFAPGSVKLLERYKYGTRFSGGPKGASEFFTASLPVAEFGCAYDCQTIKFDVQLKYIDCPTLVTVNGVETTVNRGWQVIISKEFGLWVQPDNAYAVGDELAGTNGTLRYFFSNNAGGGGAYAY